MSNINDFYLIPLGHACDISTDMNKLKLRNVSMPFDWLRTYSFSKIINLITGKEFNLIKKYELNEYPYKCYINHSYQILHFHDDFGDIDNLNQKFNRRLNRLYDIIYSKKNKIIVRYYPLDNHSYNNIFFKSTNTKNPPNDFIDIDEYINIIKNDCIIFNDSKLSDFNVKFVQIIFREININYQNCYNFSYNYSDNKYDKMNISKFQNNCIIRTLILLKKMNFESI